jgi:hypothetical protein
MAQYRGLVFTGGSGTKKYVNPFFNNVFQLPEENPLTPIQASQGPLGEGSKQVLLGVRHEENIIFFILS